jgi:hypothetical protein
MCSPQSDANTQPRAEEVLVDCPEVDNKFVGVAGRFTIEVPIPTPTPDTKSRLPGCVGYRSGSEAVKSLALGCGQIMYSLQ